MSRVKKARQVRPRVGWPTRAVVGCRGRPSQVRTAILEQGEILRGVTEGDVLAGCARAVVVALAMLAASCGGEDQSPPATAVAAEASTAEASTAEPAGTAGVEVPGPAEQAAATPRTGLAEAPAQTGLIQLQDPLDEPRSRALCLDVWGFGASLQLEAPMQLHTCKGGTVDETFMVDQPSPGQIYLVAFDRCLAAPDTAPGSMLFVETCRDAVEQRFTYSERGELHPARAPELCFAAATGRSQPASGPEYVRRDLLLQRCDRADSALIRWRVPGGRLGSAGPSVP